MRDHEESVCKHCRRAIWRHKQKDAEWNHYPGGGTYCQNRNGYTVTPLRVAEPMSHPDEGFDEGDYKDMALFKINETFVCNRCAGVTMDRGVHDDICPGKKPLQ